MSRAVEGDNGVSASGGSPPDDPPLIDPKNSMFVAKASIVLIQASKVFEKIQDTNSDIMKVVLLVSFIFSSLGMHKPTVFFFHKIRKLINMAANKLNTGSKMGSWVEGAVETIVSIAETYGLQSLLDYAIAGATCLEEDVSYEDDLFLSTIQEYKITYCGLEPCDGYGIMQINFSWCHLFFNLTPFTVLLGGVGLLWIFVNYEEDENEQAPGPPPPPVDSPVDLTTPPANTENTENETPSAPPVEPDTPLPPPSQVPPPVLIEEGLDLPVQKICTVCPNSACGKIGSISLLDPKPIICCDCKFLPHTQNFTENLTPNNSDALTLFKNLKIPIFNPDGTSNIQAFNALTDLDIQGLTAYLYNKINPDCLAAGHSCINDQNKDLIIALIQQQIREMMGHISEGLCYPCHKNLAENGICSCPTCHHYHGPDDLPHD